MSEDEKQTGNHKRAGRTGTTRRMMAAYILERDGYGCGDQGHKTAIKRMNKTGKTIWMTAFGYNGFHPLSF